MFFVNIKKIETIFSLFHLFVRSSEVRTRGSHASNGIGTLESDTNRSDVLYYMDFL